MHGHFAVKTLATMLAGIALSSPITSAQIPEPKDAPRPLDPEASKSQFQLADGFRIDLIASEPLISDPTCIAWDPRGRLFVCELHGYNLEGHLDVTELNKSGRLDTAIRRIRVGPELKARARQGQSGAVKLLRDNDGDGRMDEAIVWADDLPPSYGIICVNGGVLVTCAPDIIFLADRDGDSRPDERTILFTGFEIGELERGINNPVWGVDNWLYVAKGYGGTITGPNLEAPVALGNTDFRIKPDGSAIEPVSGANHTFGLAFDDYDNRWLITGGNHALYAVPLPYRYLQRNPHVATPDTTASAASYNRVFPMSDPHPWRQKRGTDPRWVDFYGATETAPNGYFTSACGQTIYRARLFPEPHWGNHFSCDPQQGIIHRCLVEIDGPALRVRRPPEQESSEFLASRDGWFRPNNLRVGPDGALYIVDMYREIIEDYSAIPRYLQQQYGLLNGGDRGRIWRLAPTPSEPALHGLPTHWSTEQLDNDNAWWRETAQHALVSNKDPQSVAPLKAMLRDRDSAFQTRVHALYTLQGMAELTPEDVVEALEDPVVTVRIHALRLAEPWLDEHEILRETVVDMSLSEREPRILLQMAMTLGETKDPRALQVLASLVSQIESIRWLETAILSSIGETAPTFLKALLEQKSIPTSFLKEVARSAAHAVSKDDLRHILFSLAETPSISTQAILSGLETGPPPTNRSAMLEPLLRLTRHSDGDVRLQAFLLARHYGVHRSEAFQSAINEALSITFDTSAPFERRLQALQLLPEASDDEVNAAVDAILAHVVDPDFQARAIMALGELHHPAVDEALLEALPEATPRAGATITEALLQHPSSTKRLLEAVRNGDLEARRFSELQRRRLTGHADAEIRQAAVALFAESTAPVDSLPPDFLKALDESADPERGAALFQEHCAICHQLGGIGTAVGPVLDGETGRPAASLLMDIIAPNAVLTAGYETYVVKTKAGISHAGVLAAESATSLTLKLATGVSTSVLRAETDSVEKLDVSLMPASFSETFSTKDMADLIAYLEARRAAGAVVLFDDDPAFPGILSEGKGEAFLDWSDPAFGQASLTVQPFQRFTPHVPGWNFAIRENPIDGEFRYLRLFLKTRGASGMMIELAADQAFPPENQAIRTYYVGRNDTGWKSNQLAPKAPEDWEPFTIDLWNLNGDFTLTGIAFTVMGGPASYDRLELFPEKPAP